MYKRDGVYQTKNISKGINSDRYIILHHTGIIGGGNLPILLGQRGSKVSAHFLITRNGKALKLADPKQITRHAGKSCRGFNNNMNGSSIGIEIEGSGKEPFPEVQYQKVLDVVRYLKQVLGTPIDNILKHADITSVSAIEMKLWDGISANRKTDIDRRFYKDRGFPNFKTRREIVFK